MSHGLSRRALLRGALGAAGAAAVVGPLAACGGGGAGGGGGRRVAIASGYGLSYAPLTVIESQGWLSDALPGHTVEWTVLSGGSASRDGLLGGTLEFGTSGLGPFLLGRDGGVPWRIVTSLNNMPLQVVALDERIQSLADITEEDRISSPQPGSIQAVVLARAAGEKFDDPGRFEANLVAMPHPDALQALLSGQIAAAATAPPFQYQAVEEGARVLVDSYEAFGGPHGFNVVAALEDYAEENPDVIEALHENVARACEFITDDPSRAAQILAEAEDGEVTAEQYEDYLTRDGIEFTTTPQGVTGFGAFMEEIGEIRSAEDDWREHVFDTVAGEPGS
ncbi:ABC transporter substrate-binding protein [Nocardiopsis composta]|uniref:NitT/TauT family transport system substrate-binding protein n=1 Tax=Nocardiopsis composta TaxID=157465 RepID=A0A7W8QJ86_9ACTN|nr:ABC transporter substrate-binding protein [Nocardiopsis composta]MBB5431009.1 NitT/TauT family transport system substrate-binding protein [Nocardiopsis composta]